MKKKCLSAFLALCMMLSLFAGCSGSNKPAPSAEPTPAPTDTTAEPTPEVLEPIDMKIGIGYHLGCVLFYIAQEGGFFEKNGLNVELVPFGSGNEALASMRAGQLDCADFGSGTTFTLISQGADDLRIFGGQMHEGSGIICQPENKERLSDFANYKGVKLGLVPTSTGDIVYRYGLTQAGLTYGPEGSGADVTIVEFDSAAVVIEAVKKGEVDCGGVWMPHLANAESQGLTVAMVSGEVMPNHP